MRSFKSLAAWCFSKSALPYWTILIMDCMFVVVAVIISMLLRHGLDDVLEMREAIFLTLVVFAGCFLVGFRLFHTYSGVLRFSSFVDLQRITWAVLVGMALCSIIIALFGHSRWIAPVTYIDIILTGLFLVFAMWISRIWVKRVYEEYSKGPGLPRAFIMGVHSDGVALAKNIRTSKESMYHLTGFVDPEHEKNSKLLMGIKIWPFDSKLPEVMSELKAKILIVSPDMMDELNNHEDLVNLLLENDIKIMVIPKAREWDSKNDLNLNDLHPVDVEDLLPRQKIEVDMKAAAELLEGNVVMITGAAGSIGSEMVNQIAAYNPSQLILIDQAETPMHDVRLMMNNRWPGIKAQTIVADIKDKVMMERLFRTYKPRYVFHAAAYKHVPMMEDNPYEAVVNNVDGTRVIADLAVKYGTRKFVMVSTDKAVNPTNVMGCSKRICEIYVQSLDKAIKDGVIEGKTQFVTTRFGNVLGSNGSVIPLFEEQIRNGGPVTVTHPDIIRFFMLIPEACKLVIEAGTMGTGGEIFVFDMGNPVRIADLAKRMIQLSSAKNVEIKYTGLRDGEKLYEEVLTEEEVTLPTFHPKIKIAKVREYEFGEVSKDIHQLVNIAMKEDDMHIVSKMKEIVPEFKSQHSKYEELDHTEG